ncbi:hypothetical protein GCM10009557_43700 [Virgisporangium ochraceum]|jgi:hypothetical protein|uniref:Uncharacterized protein n=1 Tax=Virgisporangium ochraceum TaxID=65505 RepID=A0A8J3ZXD6_9ACTN|nr:hypothetical protein [Virgisporangium ochraceum]GIJ70230.1 hypothetical protein Voc01_051470 [Virgisporangium ochraceum]
MDKQALLVGIVVGIMFGVTFEKFARARRDFKIAKAGTAGLGRAYRTKVVPRMLVIGFICACAGIAAFRLLLGTAE